MAQTSTSKPVNIAVLGAGSWGTALAFALARNHHQVSLWAHNPAHCAQLQRNRENRRYLPGYHFAANLHVNADLTELVQHHNRFLIVVPSRAVRATLGQLIAFQIESDALIMWGTKGFDQQGPMLISDVITEELGDHTQQAIITGPSFAKEVAADLPTAMTVAANRADVATHVADLFHGERVRVYTNNDLIGTQVGGAVKNVMAIAAGISDGLGFGANSRTAIITRGLAEITRLGVAMGAKPETFMGLSGLGDLVLTCTDNQSRNRQFGLGLGKGLSTEALFKEIGHEVEGYTNTRHVRSLAQHFNIEMPITEQVYKLLFEGVPAQKAVRALLTRNQINENLGQVDET